MKVLFVRRGMQTASHYKGPAGYVQNLIRSVSTTPEDMARNFASTRNKGNMFIGEAAQRIIKCDRSLSAHVNIQAIEKKDPISAARFANENFDYVVFSVANIIRPSLDHTHTAKFAEALDIPFCVLTAGMQSPLDGGLDALPEAAASMLRIYDKKATLFGVRGEETAAWLNKQGLHNCVVVGCPSNFLYPDNVIASTERKVDGDGVFATSGYIERKKERAEIIFNLFQNSKADYFFQEDFFHDKSGIKVPAGAYNDATGECDSEFMTSAVKASLQGLNPPFSRYWYFQSTEAWRSRIANYDAFIGDRYHGAVAALQTGVPGVVLHRDIRVREMCKWTGIPNMSLQECDGLSAKQVIDAKLNSEKLMEFRDRYVKALRNFVQALSHAGLEHELSVEALSPLPE